MASLLSIQSFAAGFLIATVTTPVGVSGAVFLLPVQLSLLHVPSPAVTPTNLLFNVVAGPGALLRHAREGRLRGQLLHRLIGGTVPGVIVGAFARVFLLPGGQVFRLLAAAVLLPLGVRLIVTAWVPTVRSGHAPLPGTTITGLAFGAGVIGGIYGIGGGSILGPLLVGRGYSVAEVAPAALASTFAASVIGALSYALLALFSAGDVAPDWKLGLLSGLGGLLGGYLGALLQPRLPERALRILLGTAAIAVGALYVGQAFG